MALAEHISIEVVAALPNRQVLISLPVPVGTTASQALVLADLESSLPELDISVCALAIWGEVVADDRVLCVDDRLEVLRPLVTDPRDARRQLASEGQFMGTGNDAAVSKPRS